MSDLIERQAAISIIQNWLNNDTGYSWGEKNVMKCAISELESLPSVTPQQNTGRWLPLCDEEGFAISYFCSECDLPMETEEKTTFCPACGVKMEVEE